MNFRVDNNGWKWVPLEWLLNNLTYSCDFGAVDGYESREHFWATMIESKALDGGFLDIVESLQEYGWREALNLELYDDGQGMEATINNGHHRLVAAILLCLDEVPGWVEYTDGQKRLPNCPSACTRWGEDFTDNLLVEVL